MNYNGWEKDYLLYKSTYDELFEECISAGEQDVSTEFLDDEIAEISKRKYAVTCASATDGLQFALQAFGVGPGQEVLVPDFSWISSASAVSMVGATPVFCDIDENTHQITLDSVKRMVTENTVAIIYPTLFGAMFPEIFAVERWCRKRGITFIEDSAQSLGVELNGTVAGSIGDISVYSFNDNKVIAGINGGGAVMTNNEKIYETVKRLAYHGRGTNYADRDVTLLGRNSKMYLFNAKIISMRLKRREHFQKLRQEIARHYFDLFIDGNDFVKIQELPFGLNHNYHKFVLKFESKEMRDKVKQHCGTNLHYPDPISANTYYSGKYKTDNGNKTAQKVADTIMSLPCHAWMTTLDVEEICDILDTGLYKSYIYNVRR